MMSFILNTITTSLVVYLLQFFGNPRDAITKSLLLKISNLEQNIFELQQTIEDLQDKMEKEKAKLQVSAELASKIDDFINYNYDVLE